MEQNLCVQGIGLEGEETAGTHHKPRTRREKCQRYALVSLKVIFVLVFLPIFLVIVTASIMIGILLLPVIYLTPWCPPEWARSGGPWAVNQSGRLIRWLSQDISKSEGEGGHTSVHGQRSRPSKRDDWKRLLGESLEIVPYGVTNSEHSGVEDSL